MVLKRRLHTKVIDNDTVPEWFRLRAKSLVKQNIRSFRICLENMEECLPDHYIETWQTHVPKAAGTDALD
ncbi:hypothetical protein [Microvirga arsenatis]|uniref:Uncharacterized protein n=1 Tax=Microvirga arsenatis TaxID=2692265 RepID=A0ABW9YTW8_9HYPH|nr:hypothetical protein [Microvirga arsenatis]NBJ12391.1 hypothetical protein [Microvirga arsenatis]NBJ23267.1 hypothetical protein [Microvirga arsenatis]